MTDKNQWDEASEEENDILMKRLGHDVDEGDDDDDEGGGISLDQILSLKDRFDAADVDGGGSLDMQEFMDAFGSIINKDGSMTEDQIARLFMQIDANADGGIDWNEFSTYMLMESQSNGQVSAKKGATFFLPDRVGQNQDVEHWHGDYADCILNEPNTAQYITCSHDGTLRIWASSTMALARTVHYGSGWVSAMCLLQKSGRLVLLTADARLKCYDYHTWELSFEVELLTPATCCCSWKNKDDSEFLAYGDDMGLVTVVDMTKGLKPHRVAKEPPATIQRRKGPNWEAATQRQVHTGGWVRQIEMVEDLGGLVSCGADSCIVIFQHPFKINPKDKTQVEPRRRLQSLVRGHRKGVRAFRWIQSHKLVISGGLERDLIVWNPYTGKVVMTLEGHTANILHLEINVEFEQLISLAGDGVLKIWDLRNNECLQSVTDWRRPDMRPRCFVFDAPRHRLVCFGKRSQVLRINPSILSKQTDITHNARVVAVLYNRMFSQVVTVAEDSEVCIWRPGNGSQIFTYIDIDVEPGSFVTCATFDDAGRRLLTGDHAGRVKVWNFSNGACIKTLEKPRAADLRQEVTGVTCYVWEDHRYIAASSWDRKMTIWPDLSEDNGSVYPYMQMQVGTDSDLLSIAFTNPKCLASASTDGSVAIFDVESGYKKLTIQPQTLPGRSPRITDAAANGLQPHKLSVEKLLFLENKNKTLVCAGSDAVIRFWEGLWMEYVPTSVSAVSLSKLVLALDAKHWPGNSIVNLTTDPENKLLVSADEGGFIKTWDISSYDWAKPHESQVKPIAFWRAHEAGGITSVDMILPHPDEDAPDAPPIPPLVLTSSADQRVLLWSVEGVLVGQFGGAGEWDLGDPLTWARQVSASLLGTEDTWNISPEGASDSSESDDEDVLAKLDERLRKKPTKDFAAKVHELKELPSETIKKLKKKKKDWLVDEMTGEKIYKGGDKTKKALVEDEKASKNYSPYIKTFVRKLDPDNLV